MTAFSSFCGLGHTLWEVDDARYAEVPNNIGEELLAKAAKAKAELAKK